MDAPFGIGLVLAAVAAGFLGLTLVALLLSALLRGLLRRWLGERSLVVALVASASLMVLVLGILDPLDEVRLWPVQLAVLAAHPLAWLLLRRGPTPTPEV